MANIFTLAPTDGGPPIWIENEDLEELKKAAYKLLEDNQGGFARFIINGKPCRVSRPVQLYFIENPEAGAAPLPFNTPGAPTFVEDGKTEFLTSRPTG